MHALVDASTPAAALAVQSDKETVERQVWDAIADDHFERTRDYARCLSSVAAVRTASPDQQLALDGNWQDPHGLAPGTRVAQPDLN